jgi:drug/metabolite transporter (DMT)-like permease
MLVILLIQALVAIIFPIGKLTLFYSGPFFTTACRMLLGGIILCLYCWWDKKAARPTYFEWKLLLLLGLTNIYFTNAFEFWGLQYMSPLKTCFLYNLAPFFSALVAYIHLGESLTAKKLLGLCISILGFFPVLYANSPDEMSLSHISFFSTAEIALIIAVIGFVYGWIIAQYFARHTKLSVVWTAGISMLIGGTLSLITSLFVESWTPPVTHFMPWFGYLLSIIILSNVICYPLYAQVLKKYTATFLTFTGLLCPAFAALFDWLIIGTPVAKEFYPATLLVCIGLYLYYQEDLRQGYLLKS